MTALTGHNGECWRSGSFKIFTESLVCMGLLHFTKVCKPGEAKKLLVLIVKKKQFCRGPDLIYVERKRKQSKIRFYKSDPSISYHR